MQRFPPLALADWRPTRDTVHRYARAIGLVRRTLAPRAKHAGEHSLYVSAAGLTTGAITAGALTFELLLDCSAHLLAVISSGGQRHSLRLRGQSAAELLDDVQALLGRLGVRLELERPKYVTSETGPYDVAAVERFWQILTQVAAVFAHFKAEQRRETSPVQLWPHHFDLAVLWFSGRLVPGADPAKPDYADEQMNFGFSTGDATIPEPYIYITAYPLPDGLAAMPLPDGAAWHSEGWQGAIMRYATLAEADARGEAADERLLVFLRTVQQAGERRMVGDAVP